MRNYLFRNRFPLGAALVIFTSALAIAATHFPSDLLPSFSPKDESILGVVQRTDLQQQVTVAGTVMPNRRTLFTPAYNGYVQKLYVRLGQPVKAGDPVVSVSQTFKGENEDIHPMRAPFSGRVVQVLKAQGEFVDNTKEGNGLVRIDDLTRLFIHCDVPESDIEKVRLGQQVLIKANAILSHPYHGVIQEISLAAKEKKDWSRSGDRVEFDVRIEINDKDDQLRSGMSATVDIITARRQRVLALSHEYIEKRGGKYFVTLGDGKQEQIQVGLENEEMFEITQGLKENERVRMVDFFNLSQK